MSNGPEGEAVQVPVASTSGDASKPTQASDQAQNANLAEGAKLSAAELKKKKQAEKQARRAQAKSSIPPPNQQKGPASKEGKPPKDQKQQNAKQQQLPIRSARRPSQSNIATLKDQKKEAKKDPKPQHSGLFFGHLYNQPRQQSIPGATKEVHPAVLALGLQYSSYSICGSTARMTSMLLAFKAVIESYNTPPGTSLARHLTSHHLSPQIDYLRSCRPLSISMGNAIRWLKDIIIKIDPATPEHQAKAELLEQIESFILQRITAADEMISQEGEKKIQPGDVILTYASSSIVEKTLLRAHTNGIPFSVIVVDSKPLFEGKRLARKLAQRGISVRYSLITGASTAINDASKVFLGAHAMMSNGRLYSRVGTAIVSMLAFSRDIPVIVLCESVKFTDRVALDSIVGNEIAPAEELLSEAERAALLPLKDHVPSSKPNHGKANATDSKKKEEEEPPIGNASVIEWFKNNSNLQMLQVLYDVTPAEYIKMVITEYGSLPPSSVPVVHRLRTDGLEQ